MVIDGYYVVENSSVSFNVILVEYCVWNVGDLCWGVRWSNLCFRYYFKDGIS